MRKHIYKFKQRFPWVYLMNFLSDLFPISFRVMKVKELRVQLLGIFHLNFNLLYKVFVNWENFLKS